ncbi:DUF805 domain-containing protein [Primorskyibacter sp. 2E107]|uniref:DUF805 domain-containing protein n=1 Tax=Primorskyibacter sp. 2E107 TaxID=3403458 RepID=UPI003AF840FC
MVGPIAAVENFAFKAFDFSGRATRAEFWWAFLFLGGLTLGSIVMDGLTLLERGSEAFGMSTLLTPWILILSFVPYLSLRIRRLHDTGRSGFWLFLVAVPLIGPVITHFILTLPSQPDENAWGQPPAHCWTHEKTSQSRRMGLSEVQRQDVKPHNAYQSYAYLVNGEAEPTPDMIEQRRNEIKDYYRTRVLGQGA